MSAEEPTLGGRGLGRRQARDRRDGNFLMMAAVPPPAAVVLPRWRYWYQSAYWLDQGGLPHCVGYSWAHCHVNGPHARLLPEEEAWASRVYHLAQQHDEWPGEDYDGTSVRGGAKAMTTLGVLSAYTWAWDLATVVRAVALVGPVVVGTTWYAGMDAPVQGVMRDSGSALGGHAYLLNGVSVQRGYFRVKNSWGRGWASRGNAWLPFDVFARLLAEDGEACLPVW